jgi:hypothetical protein
MEAQFILPARHDAPHLGQALELDAVGNLLPSVTGANAKAAADFKALWDQFKTTRDNQIIPAIYKGNADEAKRHNGGGLD